MKKVCIYYFVLVLTIAGLCSAMVGCASEDLAQTEPKTEEFPQATVAATPEMPTEETGVSGGESVVQPEKTPTQTQPTEQAKQPDKETTQTNTGTSTANPNAAKHQDVSAILNDTLAQLAVNVPEPNFGTLVGEWTVLCLARGNYYAKSDAYFACYYSRIEETVVQKAASVNQNGALHRAKSTENSRLIVALSAIGKDATNVAGWNLIAPYDNFGWITKQGINGPIWALIALDTGNYQTQDPTVRQQCLDYILERQLSDGGWALTGKVSDPDITAMTLQALYPYRQQQEVKTAADKGFACLSALQKANGGYVTFGDENSESSAQVIVACATWGIDPDTDSRFVKNGVSVLDAFLAYYVKAESGFKHIQSGKVDAMATDQGCYALIAYQRLCKGQNSLYDMTDVKS